MIQLSPFQRHDTTFKQALMLHLLPAEYGWRKTEQDGDQGRDKCMMRYLMSFLEDVDVSKP